MATRTISISLPEDLFKQAESLAKVESRTMSELFREALRSYRAERLRERLRDDLEYARSLSPTQYTEADVESLVKRDRAEQARTRRR